MNNNINKPIAFYVVNTIGVSYMCSIIVDKDFDIKDQVECWIEANLKNVDKWSFDYNEVGGDFIGM